MPSQSKASGAVFVSYASEDSEAAARICESLRAANIEVWFDKNELRGGDAWDSAIRKRVQDCALFVPLISKHTNARTEGYFRREWNLATRRLLDMAQDAHFLVPVVVDGTKEAGARVPNEFLNAQWTWLPGGDTPPEFSRHLHRLLGIDDSSEHGGQAPAHPTYSSESRATATDRPHREPTRFAKTVTLAAVLLMGSSAALWYLDRPSNMNPSLGDSPLAPPAFTSSSNDNSIAVLPFTDMSAAKNQEYMSEGIAEEILTALSQVPDLKVIARTSSFSFRDQHLDVAEIAKKLNVAHVLEGSVRSSGKKLRITAQLVRAADSTQIWSNRYDRSLDDVFQVQDEISHEIVEALKIKLIDQSSTRIRGGTKNVEAYQLYLRAADSINKGTRESLDLATGYLNSAIERDPAFGRAWSRLGMTTHYKNLYGFQSTQATYAKLREYTARALEISPDIAEAHALQLVIFAAFEFNWKAAEAAGRRALELDPNDPFTLENLAQTYGIFGNYPEAIRLMQTAVDRDPGNFSRMDLFADIYYHAGHFSDAERLLRSLLEAQPDRQWVRAYISRALLAQDKADAALEMLEQEPDEGARHAYMPIMLQSVGRRTDADIALKAQIKYWATECATCIARSFAYRGDKDNAFKWLERAYEQKDTALTNILDEPLYANVSDDPRFSAFVHEKLKLQR